MQGNTLTYKLQEYKNPVVIAAVGILLGFTSYYQNIHFGYFYFCLITFLLLSICFRNKKLLILSIAILFGYLYSTIYFQLVIQDLNFLVGNKHIYIGEVVSQANKKSKFYNKYSVALKSYVTGAGSTYKLNSKVLVYGSKYDEYEIGDILQIKGVLKRPKSAILPGLFSEEKFLFSRGIRYVLKADRGSLVYLETNNLAVLPRITAKIRRKINLIYQYYLEEDNKNLLLGIVFGSKASNLQGELKEKIQALGLAHITSASGFNVSILAVFVFYFCRSFSRKRHIPSLISIFLVFIYSALADYSSSVVRASIFIILILLGNLFNKKIKILPAVSLIIILFFICAPYTLVDIGFQLSVIAFLALVLFLGDVKNKINVKNKIIDFFLLVFFQSLIAQIFVLPLIMFYFHNIQVLGLLSNLFAVPLAALILILGLIGIPFMVVFSFGSVTKIIIFIQYILTSTFLGWMDLLYTLPGKQLLLPEFNIVILLLIYLGIFSLVCLFFFRIYFKCFILCLILLIVGSCLLTPAKSLKLIFIKQYNQDLILLVYPDLPPVLLSKNAPKVNLLRDVQTYLRLNNIHEQLLINDLEKMCIKKPEAISWSKNKIIIKYKSFIFDIVRDYRYMDFSDAFCSKLPVLMKSDPSFEHLLDRFPDCVIVNDYKKLAYSSIENLNLLRLKKKFVYLLSQTGTIVVTSDGFKYNVVSCNI